MLAERICWIVLALIHVTPAATLFAPSLLSRHYGIDGGSDIVLLLQHRGALFGVVAVACIWAAFAPGVSKLAVAIAAVSMLSFLGLYLTAGPPHALRGIAIADLIGLPFLLYLGWRAFIAA
ncbi:MAG: hypothetical protein HKN78_03155 [Sphingomonadaceae bacterium]|nr:hypothetical protein [Sphingomonadaceae bacterium]